MEISQGVIVKEKRGLYTVALSDKAPILCKAGSRIRKDGVRLLAGDRVEIELNSDGSGFIRGIKERKNCLTRPAVANIDLYVIVTATATPAPYLYNIDKLTVMAASAGVEVVVVINKCDVAPPDALLSVYERAGYRCFPLCAKSGEGKGALLEYLKGKTSVFAGASGVGKSSLLNALYPTLNAETGELSLKISRGKNTTRHTEFFAVSDGTYIADTPGFTMLDEERLGVEEKEELFFCFPEFAGLFGKCVFRGCTHLKEEGCALISAVEAGKIAPSRHESYVKLYEEIKALKRYN